MSEAAEEEHDTFVYRRVPPNCFSAKKNEITPDAFALGKATAGLSVFLTDRSSPRMLLQRVIDEKRRSLAVDADLAEKDKIEGWLARYPDVEALVRVGWRIVRVQTADIIGMGFELGIPDSYGHLDILGTAEQFEDHKADYVELIKSGRAALLTDVECLRTGL